MRKFISVLVMALMSTIVFGQQTKSSVIKNFKEGVFYLNIDDGITLMFVSDFETEKTDYFDDIIYARWNTSVNSETSEKGNEWFKNTMADKDKSLAFFSYLNKNLGMTILKYQENSDGTASAIIYLTKEYDKYRLRESERELEKAKEELAAAQAEFERIMETDF